MNRFKSPEKSASISWQMSTLKWLSTSRGWYVVNIAGVSDNGKGGEDPFEWFPGRIDSESRNAYSTCFAKSPSLSKNELGDSRVSKWARNLSWSRMLFFSSDVTWSLNLPSPSASLYALAFALPIFPSGPSGCPHLHSPVLPVLQVTQPQLSAVDGRGLAYPFELEDGAFDEEDGVLKVRRSAQEQQLRLDRIRGVR